MPEPSAFGPAGGHASDPAVDAIIIGAGPNGLVAANLLTDAGWSVRVFEAAPEPGGGVRSAELTLPGYRHDVFSAFYPFAVGSPVMRTLHLEAHGLRWCRSPVVVAHPVDDDVAVLSMDRAVTAASLDGFAFGDGDRWRELFEPWERAGNALVDALMTPFPPVRAAARLGARLGAEGALRFVRQALLPMRRLAEEQFAGSGGPALLTGLAMHADLSPECAGSGLYGWLLAGLGETHGFPVPEGGAQALTDALVRRFEAGGGQLTCGANVDRILVRDGVACGVEISGSVFHARRAVLADVAAPALYGGLVTADELPAKTMRAIERYQSGPATVKIDWALDRPIEWSDARVATSGTVHLGGTVDDMSLYAAHLAGGLLPSKPLVLMGQMATTDPSRAPAGADVAWAYTHVPQRLRGDAAGDLEPSWSADTRDGIVERMEDQIEAHAPGFRSLVKGRHVLTPPDFQAWNQNLIGGDTTGGTAQLHQQLIFRPITGWGRAETPIRQLYLASASAHPGGGVHGAPGANAARAAIAHERLSRLRRRG